ncbi:hypothetical protein LZ31DRAFT_32894 [Colletotrichum somersetense]|nr:hypothetical protein LZ31DRAFT_32894 [Colletotrichum somersetense]
MSDLRRGGRGWREVRAYWPLGRAQAIHLFFGFFLISSCLVLVVPQEKWLPSAPAAIWERKASPCLYRCISWT